MFTFTRLTSDYIYPWTSTTWPIDVSSQSAQAYTIKGQVITNHPMIIRKTDKLVTNLSNKISADVATKRHCVRIKFTSATNQQGQQVSYAEVANAFKTFISTTTSSAVVIADDTLDIFANENILAQLRSAVDGSQTPLQPNTKVMITTQGYTPFSESVVVEHAAAVMKKHAVYDEKKDNETRAGMEAFAAKYQAMESRRDAALGKKEESSDEEWD